MKFPTLAVDTANHVVYGGAIALAATLAATALGQPATAIAGVAVLAFAAGKEAADYILARRASSAPPAPAPISPALLAPCPAHLQRALATWGDLAQDYADLLAELTDCRSRHRALADAASAK